MWSIRHSSTVPAGRVRRLAGMVAVLALAAGTGAACSGGGGGGSGGKVTLTFANWAAAESATRPGLRAAIKTYEKAHPNVMIKSQPISFSDIGHQLVLRQRSGNPPDIAELSGNDTYSVHASGALEPLDDYVDSSLRGKLISSDLKHLTIDGELAAFPWTDSPQALWYNKKLLKKAGVAKPPATVDELTADLAKVHKAMPRAVGLGIDTTNRTFGLAANWSWMETFGAEPFSGSKASADTPQMKQYLSWMRELAQKDYISPGHKIGDFRPQAAQGKVAFMVDQPVLQGVIQSTAKMSDKEFYDTWGVAPMPTGSSGQSYSTALGHELVVFNNSEHKQEAFDFVKWLATAQQPVLNYTLKYESSLPPLANPSGKVAKALDTPVFDAYRKQITPTTVIPPYGRSYSDASSAVMAGVQQAITGNKPIDAVASSMQDQVQQSIG
ncbi:MAG: ABC transporter substrate-binding protein [Streptosporangiales bacterium]